MFAYEWLNKLGIWILIAAVSMLALTGLWNWVMPALGVAKLTVLQFTALFVVIHSLTFEIVTFKSTPKSPPKKTEETK